jgi:hypothetical protein
LSFDGTFTTEERRSTGEEKDRAAEERRKARFKAGSASLRASLRLGFFSVSSVSL